MSLTATDPKIEHFWLTYLFFWPRKDCYKNTIKKGHGSCTKNCWAWKFPNVWSVAVNEMLCFPVYPNIIWVAYCFCVRPFFELVPFNESVECLFDFRSTISGVLSTINGNGFPSRSTTIVSLLSSVFGRTRLFFRLWVVGTALWLSLSFSRREDAKKVSQSRPVLLIEESDEYTNRLLKISSFRICLTVVRTEV